MATTASHQSHPYGPRCRIWDRHVTKHGVLQVPVAEADGVAPAIIKVHAKYQYRIVDFIIQQRGAEPIAPEAVPQPDEVLKYQNTALYMAQIQATGMGIVGSNTSSEGAPDPSEYVYTKRGRYVFLKTTVITQASGKMRYPQAPYDTFAPQCSNSQTWVTSLVGSDQDCAAGPIPLPDDNAASGYSAQSSSAGTPGGGP